eukprot:2777088-Karenia_brevis.AAC.1
MSVLMMMTVAMVKEEDDDDDDGWEKRRRGEGRPGKWHAADSRLHVDVEAWQVSDATTAVGALCKERAALMTMTVRMMMVM